MLINAVSILSTESKFFRCVCVCVCVTRVGRFPIFGSSPSTKKGRA
uniref:Uncharacterized protein n=1 Tax=Anguilla anguilla TaxID=7936 RepID=A0A0E9QMK3_ANGAN